MHVRGREEKISENLPATAPRAPDAAGIEGLSWFIIVVVAARGACFQRVHGGELWRLPEARPFLAAVTPPKRHTTHRREGTRGAAQTVRVNSAAQGRGADSCGQQRGAGHGAPSLRAYSHHPAARSNVFFPACALRRACLTLCACAWRRLVCVCFAPSFSVRARPSFVANLVVYASG